MAAGFTILGIRPDVEFLGGTLTRPVMVLSLSSKPHGIYIEYRIPTAQFTDTLASSLAEALATGFEELYGHPGVADVAWTQEPTLAGQLADHIIIYVSSSSGNSSSVLDFAYPPFNAPAYEAAAANAQAQLDATEGL